MSQESHLKLKEIIWEITGKCKNNCEYCGSKEVGKIKSPSHEDIMTIAKRIAEYPPEQIDISGGDPLLIPFSTHKEIVDLFNSKGICSKVLANPRSIERLQKESGTEYVLGIFSLYKWAGISINTPEELKIFREFYNDVFFGLRDCKNFTIITNFNVVNLYNYNTIEQFVIETKAPWMIQYTVYPKGQGTLAVYEHESALAEMTSKIQGSMNKKIDVIISDNATSYACGAGKSSIGVLYNGDVVPCLSMRSWHTNLEGEVQGSLITSDLDEIWTNGFKKYRFGCFECCKDACKNKVILDKLKTPLNVINLDDVLNDSDDIKKKLKEWFEKSKGNPLKITPPPRIDPIVTMYAVSPGGGTVMYAVSPGGGGTVMYAVFPGGSSVDDAIYIYGVPSRRYPDDRARTLLYGVYGGDTDWNQITKDSELNYTDNGTSILNSMYAVSTGNSEKKEDKSSEEENKKDKI